MDSKVNRRDFLAKTGGGMAAAWLAGATAHASGSKGTDRPPNFIVILADDMGAKELSCYGNKVHHTPNLDRGNTGATTASIILPDAGAAPNRIRRWKTLPSRT